MTNGVLLSRIDVICDLRQFSRDVDNIGTVEAIWRQFESQLEGRSIVPGQSLQVTLPDGAVTLWVVEAHGVAQVAPDTTFRIVDLLRSPKLLYSCSICGEYGPLRCLECEQEGRESRLCSDHAQFIKDELRAYCPSHLPNCSCRNGCTDKAEFRCQRCRKLFGTHFHRHHPHDPAVDYCQHCYRILFEHCSASGCANLGRCCPAHYFDKNGHF